jgi:hypothetical protein
VTLPKAPRPAVVAAGIPTEALAARIDQFLASRGFVQGGNGGAEVAAAGPPSAAPEAVAFVCEEDVRLAIRSGRKLFVTDKTIITPAARDLGEAHRIFVETGWPN